jgi:CubicO group peptidase (beta-lactamase class C family)
MLRLAVAVVVVLPLVAADPNPSDIDAVFTEVIGPDDPGCAIGIMRSGEFIYKNGYGLADLEHRVPIRPDTRFYLASASKQFTAAATLRAAATGLLSLDDSVRKYVPELPAYADGITVRHLIHHTSGLRDYLTLQAMTGAQDNWYLYPSTFVGLLSRQRRLNFTPGSSHEYSNSGYALLSVIVGRAAKSRFRSYAEEALFRPLAMRATHFSDERREVISKRAFAYSFENGKFLHNDDLVNITGDGGVFSTIEDLVAWHRFLLSEHAQPLAVVGTLNDGKKLDYAFGLVEGDGFLGRYLAHGGTFKGYRASIMHYPSAAMTFVCLCNNGRLSAVQLVGRVSSLYTGKGRQEPVFAAPSSSTPAAQPPILSSAALKGYAGRYYSEELDSWYDITEQNGSLRFRCRSINEQLEPVAEDQFRWSSWRMRFDRDGQRAVTGFWLSGNRVKDVYLQRHSTP